MKGRGVTEDASRKDHAVAVWRDSGCTSRVCGSVCEAHTAVSLRCKDCSVGSVDAKSCEYCCEVTGIND